MPYSYPYPEKNILFRNVGDTVTRRCQNPIESTFATVRLRTKVTKGAASTAAGRAMAFELAEAAQARCRAVNAPHLVALLRADAMFVNGELVERPADQQNHTPPIESAA